MELFGTSITRSPSVFSICLNWRSPEWISYVFEHVHQRGHIGPTLPFRGCIIGRAFMRFLVHPMAPSPPH